MCGPVSVLTNKIEINLNVIKITKFDVTARQRANFQFSIGFAV